DAVIEDSEDDVELATGPGGFDDRDAQLVVMIANARHLAPWLRPRLIDVRSTRARDSETIAQCRRFPKVESERRWQDQPSPVAAEAIDQPSVADSDLNLVA